MIEEQLPSVLEHTVLILAPTGQDAAVAAEVLAKENIRSEIVRSMKELCVRLGQPASTIILAEEALSETGVAQLSAKLREQATWSDIPILLLTSDKKQLYHDPLVYNHFVIAANVSLLERPFRLITLITAVCVAVRARQRQYQVRDLLSEQNHSLMQRDEFLSIASHELKTPLTSLKLQVQMRKRFIKRGDASVYAPEKVNALIETTEHQVERLSRLVDDMLDISRIDNGKLALHYEACDLCELTEQVLESFSANFQAAECLVTLKADEKVEGHWDRYRIEQVIANLITNAIKYAPGKPVHVEVTKRNGIGIVTVKDHGAGISPKDQTKIFQRFERADSAGKVSGLGLGLFITRQILEMHNGDIRVESELGKGTTFTIELPILNPEDAHVAV